MNTNREQFFKTYANIPLALRDEIILVVDNNGTHEPITWNVAYIEIKGGGEKAEDILNGLTVLELI